MIRLYRATIATEVLDIPTEETKGLILRVTKLVPKYKYIHFSRMFETQHDLKRNDDIIFPGLPPKRVEDRTFHCDLEGSTGGFLDLWLGSLYSRPITLSGGDRIFSKAESDAAVASLKEAGFRLMGS